MPKARLAVGIGVAVLTAAVVVLLVRSGDSGDGGGRPASVRPAPQVPVVVGLERLRRLAESIGHPVYWAGKRPGGYELTVDVNSNIFIRYLRAGESAGSRRTSLTVATYPFARGYEILKGVSGGAGETTGYTPDGGLVVVAKAKFNNAYIAYPGTDLQIEVYDPKPGRAFELATAGAISRIN